MLRRGRGVGPRVCAGARRAAGVGVWPSAEARERRIPSVTSSSSCTSVMVLVPAVQPTRIAAGIGESVVEVASVPSSQMSRLPRSYRPAD